MFNKNSKYRKLKPLSKQEFERKKLYLNILFKHNGINFYNITYLEKSQNIIFLYDSKNTKDKHFFIDTFNSNEFILNDKYIIFEYDRTLIKCIFFYNENDLEYKNFFYSKNIIGLVISRFFTKTEYILKDDGLYLDKKNKLICSNYKEILNLLQLEENNIKSLSKISDIYDLVKKSPYYDTEVFTKLYKYKLYYVDPKIIFLLIQFKTYINKNETEPVVRNLDFNKIIKEYFDAAI